MAGAPSPASGAGPSAAAPGARPRRRKHFTRPEVCLDFLKGQCEERRAKCRFLHPDLSQVPGTEEPSEPAEREVCEVWVLTGRCKFGAKCEQLHPVNLHDGVMAGEEGVSSAPPPPVPRKRHRKRKPRRRRTPATPPAGAPPPDGPPGSGGGLRPVSSPSSSSLTSGSAGAATDPKVAPDAVTSASGTPALPALLSGLSL